MKNSFVVSLSLTLMLSNAFAQEVVETRVTREANPNIYPAKPFDVSYIRQRVQALTENKKPLMNVHEMERLRLNRVFTKTQPWGGPYWALNQGLIANNYQDKDYELVVRDPNELVNWSHNVEDFKVRRDKHLPQFESLSEKDLAKLAPSINIEVVVSFLVENEGVVDS